MQQDLRVVCFVLFVSSSSSWFNCAKVVCFDLDETVDLFSMKMPRHLVLTKGLEHQAHHRGQTTIYLRLEGVSPSERLF